ncbi:MAG: hypothetical protein U0470_06500 [Anaerolineae bacterium]
MNDGSSSKRFRSSADSVAEYASRFEAKTMRVPSGDIASSAS